LLLSEKDADLSSSLRYALRVPPLPRGSPRGRTEAWDFGVDPDAAVLFGRGGAAPLGGTYPAAKPAGVGTGAGRRPAAERQRSEPRGRRDQDRREAKRSA
jgi:hypothetical protein